MSRLALAQLRLARELVIRVGKQLDGSAPALEADVREWLEATAWADIADEGENVQGLTDAELDAETNIQDLRDEYRALRGLVHEADRDEGASK